MLSKEECLKIVGDKVRAKRLSKDLTQNELASLINKNQQDIQRLEKGLTNPTYYFLALVANALGLTVDELVK